MNEYLDRAEKDEEVDVEEEEMANKRQLLEKFEQEEELMDDL
jgi:hypothetical protein